MKELKLSTAELFALQEMISESGYQAIEDNVKKAVYISLDSKVYNLLSEDDIDD